MRAGVGGSRCSAVDEAMVDILREGQSMFRNTCVGWLCGRLRQIGPGKDKS